MKGKFAGTLILLVGMLAYSGIARAEARGVIKLNVPFAFIVNGETLPAGAYTLSRLDGDRLEGFLLRNEATHSSVFLHPEEVADATSDKPEVNFERVGDAHFLKRIKTSYVVYDIPVQRHSVPVDLARLQQPKDSSPSTSGN
jgi:hypothetical protein